MGAGLGRAACLLVELRKIQSGVGVTWIRLYGAQQEALNLLTFAGEH